MQDLKKNGIHSNFYWCCEHLAHNRNQISASKNCVDFPFLPTTTNAINALFTLSFCVCVRTYVRISGVACIVNLSSIIIYSLHAHTPIPFKQCVSWNSFLLFLLFFALSNPHLTVSLFLFSFFF